MGRYTLEYYEALLKCGDRYKELTDDPELIEFIDLFILGIFQAYPLLKLNRWLGYIQGRLIASGKTSVEEERNWTRPLFKHLDFN